MTESHQVSTIDAAGGAGLKEMLERALAFTERLLAENGRLRKSLASVHAGSASGVGSDPRVADLMAEGDRLRAELARRDQGAPAATPDIETLRQELDRERLQRHSLEEQNNSLANLYVASNQLHSTLDFKEVVAIVMEIVTNLVGAERFALLLVDGRTSTLQVISEEGLDGEISPIPLGSGIVGGVATSAQAWFRPGDQSGPASLESPLAAIPLKVEDRVIGVLSVWGLFKQKKAFGPLDHELFTLLAGHAATALFAAKLYGDAERKLSTIQGFLDLLTTG